jgi:exonuclease SbcD
MRVIHTADWHLGQELYGFDRTFEHERFLDWLGSQLVEREVDALVVTGDVFDTTNPPVDAQRMLYAFLRRVLTDCPRLHIVIVGGNHDSAARLELPRPLLDPGRVTLMGSMPRRDGSVDPAATVRTLADRDGTPRLCCAAVPYLRPGDVPDVDDGGEPVRALYEAVVRAAQKRGPGLPLVVTGHLNVAGGVLAELSERRILVGGVEAVAPTTFPPDVAYTALGHLHRPQAVEGRGTVRYSGSPFPMAMTEMYHEHSVVEIDFDAAGVRALRVLTIPRAVEFVRVPVRGAHSLDDVVAALRGLPDVDPGENRRAFLEVAVRLDGPAPELRERIDGALAGKPYRLTRVVRETEAPAATQGQHADSATLDELHPEDVFRLCHERQYGWGPSAELARAFTELLASAGAGEEGNA